MNTLFGWMGSRQTQSQFVPKISNSSLEIQSLILKNSAVAYQPGNIKVFRNEDGFIAVQGKVFLKNTSQQPTHPEYILKQYQRLGAQCINQLDGHFLILILQDKNQEIFIAQDKLGTYPFYYCRTGQGLYFGNHLKAFSKQLDLKNKINLDAIYHYLYYHMIPSPLCIYKDFHRLMPGHYLIMQNDRLKTLAYWHPVFMNQSDLSFKQKREQLQQKLTQVMPTQTSARFGCFLSGGIDSTSVLGHLTKAQNAPIDAFTIGFDAEQFDEVEYAKIAAKKFDARHHIYYLKPNDIIDSIPKLQNQLSQPFGNASLIPTYYCAKLAKQQNIDILYAGDGGDELFGGNTRYSKQILLSYYHKVPKFFRKNIIEPTSRFLKPMDRLPLVHKVLSYIEQANTPMPQRMEAYNLLNRIGHQCVLSERVLDEINSNAPLQLLCHYYTQTDAKTVLGKMLATDMKFTLADNDLVKVRTGCEAANIGIEFPLLDDQIMQFALDLSDRDKVRGQHLRVFYKRALSDLIPKEIIQKSKHGFGLPYGLWIQQDENLKAFTHEHLQALKHRDWIDPNFIDLLFHKYLIEHPNYYGVMCWILIMLENWLQQQNASSSEIEFSLLDKSIVQETAVAESLDSSM